MEKKHYDEEWVRLLAEQLVIDVTDWMAGIPLIAASPPAGQRSLDAVRGRVEGELELDLRFAAEPELLHRLAAAIMGREPDSPEEVREYAEEYFNILCGRFVSELCRGRKPRLRFLSPRCEDASHSTPLTGETTDAVYLISDRQEQIVFSWSGG